MEGVRVRFDALIEWLLAAACIAGAVAVGAVVVDESSSVRAVMPVIAGEAPATDVPAGVPPRSVSVPMLFLANGRHLRIGDTAEEVTTILGSLSQTGAEQIQRGAHGTRITRFYNYAGTLFTLVFELPRSGSELRVSAIYLQ